MAPCPAIELRSVASSAVGFCPPPGAGPRYTRNATLLAASYPMSPRAAPFTFMVATSMNVVGLALVHHAVDVLVLAQRLALIGAVDEPVAVAVHPARVGLAQAHAPVVVLVLHAVLELVAVGVGVVEVGLAGIPLAVVVGVLD